MRAAWIAVLALAGCVERTPFVCEEDEQCGEGGRCEDGGACSFTDDSCHGQRRYGDLVDPDLAGVCLGDVSGPIATFAAGSDRTCGAAEDGHLWCWGDNTGGALGREDALAARAPLRLDAVDGVTDVDGGEYHTCAVAGGDVSCWGRGEDGQLGDGTRGDRALPGAVTGMTGIVEVELGEQHSCARSAGGGVWCWGRNADDELGGGGVPDSAEPIPVDVPPADALAAGGQNGCVIAGEEVHCWGKNTNGQLGLGDELKHNRPELIPGFAGAVQIAVGGEHICARFADGSLRCAGANSSGQLGDGTGDRSSVPVAVVGISGVTDVVALDWTTCAIDGTGAVLCWGINDLGQVGSTGEAKLEAPGAPVPLPRPAVALTGGENHACAQTDDGCLWCWGSDEHGQLGGGRSDQAELLRAVLLSCNAPQ
jgi:alpha-tubulin suppressor-like RCC1 family protein